MQLLIHNIGTLYGILPKNKAILKGEEMSNVRKIDDAYLLIEDGIIKSFGHHLDKPAHIEEIIDAEGQNVMPSFIDSHTHLVFADTRENEFEMKIAGKSYAEIAAAGGGILNSAKSIAATDFETLYQKAYDRAIALIKMGTCAIEIKSGYGLDGENELKMLQIIDRLKKELPITIKTTFLAAHALPASANGNTDAYVNDIIDNILPELIKTVEIDYIDLFCETGFFNQNHASQIIEAGVKHNLKAKIHGNQLGHSGGAMVAAKHNILSVDHLEFLNQEEINALKKSQTIPVVLPNCSYYLKMQYAPAKDIIRSGLPLAIASDYNPGSAPSGNLWVCWSLACTQMRLTPNQAFNALTINAAAALEIADTHGSITEGKAANFIFTNNHQSLSYYPYSFGENPVNKIMLNGKFMQDIDI